MKFNRQDIKKQLQERTKESYETRDDSGKYGKYYSSLPFPTWKCGEGEHVIDIVPFPAGEHYPTKSHMGRGVVDPEKWVYWLDVWVHFNVGAGEEAVVCPAASYNERCPICEDVAQMMKRTPLDEELIRNTKAKRRGGYLIICRDSTAEENKGLQFFEVAHYYFEKHISSQARKPFGGGFVPFSDPDDGKAVYFIKSGTGMGQEWSSHQFLDRDYVIPDEIMEKTVPLADFLNRYSYEELYEMYWGTPYKEGETPQKKAAEGAADYNPSSRAPKTEGTSSTRSPKAEPKEEPAPTTRARKPVQEEAPEPATRKPVQEEAQEEAPPPPRSRRPLRQEPAPEPEPEKAKSTTACPGGGNFGIDVDKLSHCGVCDIWDDCAAESQKIEEEKKAAGAAGSRRPR